MINISLINQDWTNTILIIRVDKNSDKAIESSLMNFGICFKNSTHNCHWEFKWFYILMVFYQIAWTFEQRSIQKYLRV